MNHSSIARSQPQPNTIGRREFAWGERTYVMGIVNVTPDSFSGDGVTDVDAAVRRAVAMCESGADLIDVGGESTRPGPAEEISAEEELRRTIPVIERLAKEVDAPVSIDTYKAEVAKAAIESGAALVNDVFGFRREPEIARVAAEAGVPAVAMHMQRGREFKDTIGNIIEGWLASLKIARAQGLPEDCIILDPGFNFGWTVPQALEMLRRIDELRILGRPILVGTSRKSTIGKILDDAPVDERLEGTAATVAIAIAKGADIVRVHDVMEIARVAKMADAVARGWKETE